jgi:hypothetical protein
VSGNDFFRQANVENGTEEEDLKSDATLRMTFERVANITQSVSEGLQVCPSLTLRVVIIYQEPEHYPSGSSNTPPLAASLTLRVVNYP